jgi:hypothetical protein
MDQPKLEETAAAAGITKGGEIAKLCSAAAHPITTGRLASRAIRT